MVSKRGDEVQAPSEVGDVENIELGQVHAGTFEVLAGVLIADRFDLSRADREAVCLGGGVVHVLSLVDHVRQQ